MQDQKTSESRPQAPPPMWTAERRIVLPVMVRDAFENGESAIKLFKAHQLRHPVVERERRQRPACLTAFDNIRREAIRATNAKDHACFARLELAAQVLGEIFGGRKIFARLI